MSSEHEFGNVGSEDVLNTGAAHFGPTKFHNPGNRKCPVNVQSFEVFPAPRGQSRIGIPFKAVQTNNSQQIDSRSRYKMS